MKKKRVALVLSGGSALGFAHIGVIKVLLEYGVPIDMVVGTSMGGLVGAVFASGMSVDDMTKLACKFRKINFFDFNFNTSGIFSGRGMMRTICKFLPNKDIRDMDIKYACVSCDLMTERQVVITSGNIRDAIRCTVSIPGFFVPMFNGDEVLVDGGVINNLPDDVAKKMGADIIISCDVLKNCKMLDVPSSIFETLVYSMNTLSKTMQRYKGSCSDIILEPDLTGLTHMSFGRASTLELISRGEDIARKNIKKILRIIE